uniref:Odorant receptor n=1 Tax=Campoletis chlorideae TaxID=219166 RepID=A0A346D3W1_9HYME|nr:odorant receptor [Campoletis chlorideae]
MDFYNNQYYRNNAILLTCIGQWPQQSDRWHHLQQFFIHTHILTVMVVQLIKMFEMWGNVDIMIECFTPVGVQLAACVKSINCMLNCHKLRKLVDHIGNDWASLKDQREIHILRRFANDGRIMTLAYAIFLFGSMMVYLLIPLMPPILDVILPLNASRQRKYLYHTEYYVDSESNYYWIVLHTYSGTILTIWTVVSVDTMYATYVQHACGLMEIDSERLKNTSENVNGMHFGSEVSIQYDDQYRELINCIKKHQRAIKFAVLLESCYSNGFLLQLGISMALISVSLLQLLTKMGQYDEMYRILQFTAAQLFHIFFNSWPGQKLIDQSTILSESVYFSGWQGFSLRSKHLIKIVMLSAAMPLKITAAKFYDMSMENFGMVCIDDFLFRTEYFTRSSCVNNDFAGSSDFFVVLHCSFIDDMNLFTIQNRNFVTSAIE